ncbi:hypothetical protein ASPZODRAFT_129600 [Penicilliopsis zonata CBS 506.65]|uniref:NGG1 interacting factor Nif3 n=1 Tax=Penicilliopsis zonata CBS 506.65 TaxID=1073090 RepID=A0A1L9SPK1_9EURO|nr:hypothetical protein ASPZODRAFT_129600 [Penicilliopsis zonata CBS 506.65]OJJ49189.1 hypothetical protein ASPZODRAFT_129600 [Penicilliopsis zonata CBS 506.65]
MSSLTSSAPFTQAVVSSMRKLYPESLADKSFDNTGLLLEAPFNPSRRQRNSVLLTIDLTKAVADEAIKRKDSVVVAYHPIIFRGLKSLTLNDPQQQSLLRLAQEGISVYSPHTAVDSVPGGMADWLCDVVTGAITPTSSSSSPSLSSKLQSSSSEVYTKAAFPQPPRSTTQSSPTPHTRSTIHPSPPPIPEGFESAGAGRLVTFSTPQRLTSIIDRIASGTGYPAGIPIAVPQNTSVDDAYITTIGICPGSGSSVLLKAGVPLPDLLFTGELSHHEALAAIERGSFVVALSHSNTERGYLHSAMREKLLTTLKTEWEAVRSQALGALTDAAKQGAQGEAKSDAYADVEVIVDVSERDRDPYGFMVLSLK